MTRATPTQLTRAERDWIVARWQHAAAWVADQRRALQRIEARTGAGPARDGAIRRAFDQPGDPMTDTTTPTPDPTAAPVRRRLHEHIVDALAATARRIMTAHPDRRDDLADWLDNAHEHIVIVPCVDRRADGRIDTRSYRLDVYLATAAGVAPLVSVRRRDLELPPDVQHEDAQAECRTLLLQLGQGIPDDPSALLLDTDDGPDPHDRGRFFQ